MSLAVDVLVWIIRHLGLLVGLLGFATGMAVLAFVPMARLGGLLPATLVESIATNLLKVVLIAQDGGRLHQTETDEYELLVPSGDEAPRNYWSRLAGQPFALSWARTEAALRDGYERVDTTVLADGGTTLRGSREAMGPDRGGLATFLDAGAEPGLFVRAGEKLAALKDTDGLDAVNVAVDETMAREGGSQSMGTKWRVIFWLGMAFFGSLGGLGVFFLL